MGGSCKPEYMAEPMHPSRTNMSHKWEHIRSQQPILILTMTTSWSFTLPKFLTYMTKLHFLTWCCHHWDFLQPFGLSGIFQWVLKPRNDMILASSFRRWSYHYQWEKSHQASCLPRLNGLLCSHLSFSFPLPILGTMSESIKHESKLRTLIIGVVNFLILTMTASRSCYSSQFFYFHDEAAFLNLMVP